LKPPSNLSTLICLQGNRIHNKLHSRPATHERDLPYPNHSFRMPAVEIDASPEPEAPKTEPTHTVEDAIREATNDRVRIVLLNMVKENPIARELASKALLVQQKDSRSTGNNKKRKRYEICRQCSKEYAVEENHGKICVHHPGMSAPCTQSSIMTLRHPQSPNT
jgi:hypothetical protein